MPIICPKQCKLLVRIPKICQFSFPNYFLTVCRKFRLSLVSRLSLEELDISKSPEGCLEDMKDMLLERRPVLNTAAVASERWKNKWKKKRWKQDRCPDHQSLQKKESGGME